MFILNQLQHQLVIFVRQERLVKNVIGQKNFMLENYDLEKHFLPDEENTEWNISLNYENRGHT